MRTQTKKKKYSSLLVAGALALCSMNSHAIEITEDIAFDTDLLKNYLFVSKKADSGDNGINLQSSNSKYGHFSQIQSHTDSGDFPSGLTTINPTFDGDMAILQDNAQFDGNSASTIYGSTGVSCNANGHTDPTDCAENVILFDDDDGSGALNQTDTRGMALFTPTELTNRQNQVNTARDKLLAIAALSGETIITDSGLIDEDRTINLDEDGLNLFFFDTNSDDISLNNASIEFTATGANAGDRQAIIFIEGDSNLLLSNANIFVGEGMGLMDVLFVSLNSDNGTHFGFSNANLYGVSFWDMARAVNGSGDASVSAGWNNVSGCTQVVGDEISLSSNNYLSTCGFRGLSVPNGPPPPPVSEPETVGLFSMMLFAAGWASSRRRKS